MLNRPLLYSPGTPVDGSFLIPLSVGTTGWTFPLLTCGESSAIRAHLRKVAEVRPGSGFVFHDLQHQGCCVTQLLLEFCKVRSCLHQNKVWEIE